MLAALVQVGDGLATSGDVLAQLCRSAGALGVAGADVMVVEGERLRLVEAAPVPFREFGRLQEQLQRGPCADCVVQREPVAVSDLREPSPWPELATAARGLGIGSVLSAPLLARGATWGALDLYRAPGVGWTQPEVAAATLLAGIAAAQLAAAAGALAARHDQLLLEHRATHDELTGLPTRSVLVDRLEHALLRARRQRQGLAVLFIDVDRFKEINDRHGHAVGDAVLVEVAYRLQGAVRVSDSLGRWSGDEFVVVCEDVSGAGDPQAHALALSRRIHDDVTRPVEVAGLRIEVSVSIGIAVDGTGPGGRVPGDLIAAADRGMYSAKRDGRGRTVVSPP